ncbi:hypothetical protein GGF31_004989 [Allomyces arbusculus]|nr:hypothetical protein GGF31_004989 [Allomyces arbusculus]
MPVRHIVLFKLKEDASPDAIAHMKAEILALKDRLPHLVMSVTVNESFTTRHKGFSTWTDKNGAWIVLDSVLVSREALAEYSPHPIHQDVVQNAIKPILDDIMAVDYDC